MGDRLTCIAVPDGLEMLRYYHRGFNIHDDWTGTAIIPDRISARYRERQSRAQQLRSISTTALISRLVQSRIVLLRNLYHTSIGSDREINDYFNHLVHAQHDRITGGVVMWNGLFKRLNSICVRVTSSCP